MKNIKSFGITFILLCTFSISAVAQPMENTTWYATGPFKQSLDGLSMHNYRMIFLPGNRLEMNFYDASEQKDSTTVGIWWQTDATHFKFVDTSAAALGQVCDPTDSALVTYTIEGDTLTMTSVDDQCITRGSIYIGSKWSRYAAGVKRISSSHLSIYPNPVTDIVHVNIIQGEEAMEAALFNAQGALVKSMNITAQLAMDVSDLPAGVYCLRVFLKDEYFASKLLVKK